ncbi:BMC_2a_G0038800.mRNA.1.CDS.1 [Saccharomyces cerevisiae]|nr:Ssp120p [Saccharomyces cerevisiae YJM1447]CAI4552326.1 BMC_2a_G0038800.mRNA.1.CDS.1 [Saccharomyces cerevisiae]CAI4555888.1 BMB_G0038790.mRNA.1.CDS.1 [Saccharomyces cerevisiae]CAI7176930.1 BMC_2a_G0038800.mRNA.1.CDS.1 [Saccharomyces cerevisiae]CAI7179660.1 BMB_G0038790.mRNA.1.CDS.1 [Saccharomyces cerevisiae]
MRFLRGFVFSLAFTLYKVTATAEIGSEINVENEAPPDGLSWEEWHMGHEHQLKDYTPETFFALHDIKKKGFLDENDILSLYGLNREEIVGAGDGMGQHDESEKIDNEMAKRVVSLIMRLLDVDDNTKITKEEYLQFAKRGNKFPDLGVGVGHHSDFELEYEIHHWNKFHKDKDPDVKVVHKEDIEHELLHHEHEIEHEEEIQRGASRATVITDDELESRIELKNIPEKFKNGIF